jgi:hypothetical protein
MKIMLTGDASEGVYWKDVSQFDIENQSLTITWASGRVRVVTRAVLTVNSPELVISFIELMECVIESARAERHITGTGELIAYECEVME